MTDSDLKKSFVPTTFKPTVIIPACPPDVPFNTSGFVYVPDETS